MSSVQCAVCQRPKVRNSCEIIRLTREEKESIRKLGGTPPDEYFYCKPCWRIITDRQKGADLQKGIIQVGLQRIGVSNAEEVADKYRKKLLDITPTKPRD